jgi:alanine racemase
MNKLPTWVDIDLDALVDNLGAIRSTLARGVAVLLTIKADAYGHGAVQIAQAADEYVDWYGVATLDEARELRKAEVRKKILILSPVLDKEIPGVVDNGFATTVSSLEFALALSAYAAKRGVTVEAHVEVDTGMGRTGFFADEAVSIVTQISGLAGLHVGGVFTHYPSSDIDPDFTREQARRFIAVVARLKSSGVETPLVHSANSAALAGVPETHMQMVRPGLVAYGHCPAGANDSLRVRPVMSWKSRLVQVRRVPTGTSVSYGRTYVTSRESLMGVVPVGYGHGYPYRLSNAGRMIVGGKFAPIMGRVTMDMTMLDLTDISPAPRVGDVVVLIGQSSGAGITVEDIAGWAGTISYEIMCGISKRVPRMYLRGGRIETFKSLLGVLSSQVNV